MAGFADATGALPAAGVHPQRRRASSTRPRRLLGVDHEELSDLALAAPDGADGLVLVPYLEGERTPNLPDATGSLHGMTPATMSPGTSRGPRSRGCCASWPTRSTSPARRASRSTRLTLVGGGAQSRAVREIAPRVFGLPVAVPQPGEYVADGAARQAAWTLSGRTEPPRWESPGTTVLPRDPVPGILARYREVAAGPEALDPDPPRP